jgi:hypothetical protein
MTFPIFVEVRPAGEDHTIPAPPGYDRALYDTHPARSVPPVGMDEPTCGWPAVTGDTNWRRMRSSAQLDVAYDVTQINTRNDFERACVGGVPSGCNAIDRPPAGRDAVLARGREYAAGYLHYLQHDVARADGTGSGYPNLRPAVEVTGTSDGVSRLPYLRESRRIRALVTIREDDLSYTIVRAATSGAVRARAFEDAVAIGQYAFDLHYSAAGDPLADQWHAEIAAGMFETNIARTLPFQVPLGAFVPETVDGLVAAGKNIGGTHITNGALRLHPVEWHIGLAAGALAARAVMSGAEPREVYADRASRRRVQHDLLARLGSPLQWFSDVLPSDSIAFRAAHFVSVEGVMRGSVELRFDPATPLERWVAAIVLVRLLGGDAPSTRTCPPSYFTDLACDAPYRGWIDALVEAGGLAPGGTFRATDVATRRELAQLFVAALRLPSGMPSSPTFPDVPAGDPGFAAIEALAAAGVLREESPSTFAPDAPATRRTAAIWSYEILRARYGIP